MAIAITESQSNAIKIVRVLAMMSIVACHYCQAFQNKWAWIFNIGVQIFLVLSGFLYGKKNINNWGGWFLNRLIKIYLPCFIWLLISIPIYLVFSDASVNSFNWLCVEANKGFEQLWFLKTIGICYLITPILQLLKKHPYLLIAAIVLTSALEFFIIHFWMSYYSLILCYVLGYLYSSINDIGKKILLILLVLLSITLTIFASWDNLLMFGSPYERGWHTVMGFVLCIGGIFLFDSLSITKTPRVLILFDTISFYVYLTHALFLMGPFSFLSMYRKLYIGIICSIMCIIASACALYIFSSFIQQKLQVKQ